MSPLFNKASRILLSILFLVVYAYQPYCANVYSASAGSVANNLQPSYFTGQTGYIIPVYTLDDADFPIKLTLRYESAGFKPFQSSGCYGQGWSLSAGGYISRIVQDFPDEQLIEYIIPHQSYDIYFGMHNSFIKGWIPDKDRVFSMLPPEYSSNAGVQYPYDTTAFIPCWTQMEYMPDIYYFNFMGYQGRFIINNQGVPTIISGDFVNINISRLCESYPNAPYYSSLYVDNHYYPRSDSLQITITTMDGFRYVFGGSKDAVEYSVLSDELYQLVPSINTWHLSSIIAPSGRIMTFRYVTDNNFYHLRYFTTEYDPNATYEAQNGTHIMHTLHKKCLLQSITTSDSIPLTMTFFSSEESYPMYQNTNLPYCHPNLKLDSICVHHGTRTLASTHLNYTWRRYDITYGVTTNYFWRYLSSVHIAGVGTYALDYNLLDPYPSSAPQYLHMFSYPNIYVTSDAEYENLVDQFGFWKVSSLQGLLSNVTLPTGGKIHFTYGSHQYGAERRYYKTGLSNVTLTERLIANQTIGGARIEKIETFAQDSTLVETNTFLYNLPGTTNSSGVFYNVYKIFDSSTSETGNVIVHPNNYGLLDSHIGYSSVQRLTTTGNNTYKTVYTFDTGHDSYTSVNNSTIHRNTSVQGYADSIELRSGSLTYAPQLLQTGKILAVEQYLGNTIQKATYYRYNGIQHTATNLPAYDGISLGCIDTIVCLSTYSAHVARKLFVIPNVLEQNVTHEYTSDGQVMVTSTSYTYDKLLRRKKVTTTDSRGRTLFSLYTYPNDIASGALSPLSLLVRSHRIKSPVEILSGYKENDTEYLTSGTIEIYQRGEEYYIPAHSPHNAVTNFIPLADSISGWWDSIPVGGVKYYPYLYQTHTLSLDNPITLSSYQPMSTDGYNVTYDSHYRLTCQYFSDIQNRLLSIQPFGKAETRYTWNGIYPATKTIGNQTWTYTYIPYVGVSSMTDPRGITTYYTYDLFGRLIEEYQVLNGQKQILNAYHYHIKTE